MDVNANREQIVQQIINDWDPDYRPVHCSNCRHAIVYGNPKDPSVRCEMGHGNAPSIFTLIRRQSPRGFKVAADCSDFDNMGDY